MVEPMENKSKYLDWHINLNELDKPLCHCQENEALPDHECPYSMDVGNGDTICNCCESCQAECCSDI